MNSVANYAAKKAVSKIHVNRQPSFETDPDILAAAQEIAAQQTKHWYNKKVKPTPDLILSKEERKLLKKVKNKAWYLDKGFHCCCFDIGLDGLIGLIPGIGDVITSVMALQLVRTASGADLPNSLIVKMTTNVFIDFMIGLTPIAGDILDVLFKCNIRNAVLLEEYLIKRRMDEIRLEKGLAVSSQGESSNTKVLPPPPLPSRTTDQVIIEQERLEPPKENKYGTFFNWK